MTTRLKGVTVAFDAEYRDDDAESIILAIRMIKGVSAVVAVEAGSEDWFARQRVRMELSDSFRAFQTELLTGKKP